MKFFQRILVLLIISNIFISKTQAACLGNSTQSTCQSSSPSTTDTTNNNTCSPWTGLTNTPVENYPDICVFNTSNSSCCVNVGCVANAHYTSSGGGCVCDNTFHISGSSCIACQDCGVTAGTAVKSTVNNNCYYTISCNTGYEILETNNHCSSSLYAVCTPVSYNITLDPNGGTGTWFVSVQYGSTMPTPPSLATRSGYMFNGYFDATTGGTQYYTSTGTSAHTWDKTANTTLYAHWTQCPTGSGTNGTVSAAVVSNACRYYITCNAGFENNNYYDSSHTTTTSTISCATCSAGYYCPSGGGFHHNCTGGTTSNAGATAINNCYIQGGSSTGTKFCDSNGCFYLPSNVGY